MIKMKNIILILALALVAVMAAPAVAQLGSEIGDAENESGSIESENDVGVDGDNNNVCLGILDFENSGNFTNQQAVTIYEDEENDGVWHRHHRGDRESSDEQDDEGDRDNVRWHFHKNKGGGNEFLEDFFAPDIEIEGPEITFAPENETECEQAVEQAAAASSTDTAWWDAFWWWWDAYWEGYWMSADGATWTWWGPWTE